MHGFLHGYLFPFTFLHVLYEALHFPCTCLFGLVCMGVVGLKVLRGGGKGRCLGSKRVVKCFPSLAIKTLTEYPGTVSALETLCGQAFGAK